MNTVPLIQVAIAALADPLEFSGAASSSEAEQAHPTPQSPTFAGALENAAASEAQRSNAPARASARQTGSAAPASGKHLPPPSAATRHASMMPAAPLQPAIPTAAGTQAAQSAMIVPASPATDASVDAAAAEDADDTVESPQASGSPAAVPGTMAAAAPGTMASPAASSILDSSRIGQAPAPAASGDSAQAATSGSPASEMQTATGASAGATQTGGGLPRQIGQLAPLAKSGSREPAVSAASPLPDSSSSPAGEVAVPASSLGEQISQAAFAALAEGASAAPSIEPGSEDDPPAMETDATPPVSGSPSAISAFAGMPGMPGLPGTTAAPGSDGAPSSTSSAGTSGAASSAMPVIAAAGNSPRSAADAATPSGLGIGALTGGGLQAPTLQVGETAALPAPVLKIHAAVESAEFAQDLSDRVSWMMSNGVNSARLQVNPPQLGPIELSIQVQGDHAQVTMTTHSAVTRDALESGSPQLRDMLGAQGFGQVSVDISQRSFQDRAAYAPIYQRATPGEGIPVAAAPTTATLPQRAPTGVLDAYA